MDDVLGDIRIDDPTPNADEDEEMADIAPQAVQKQGKRADQEEKIKDGKSKDEKSKEEKKKREKKEKKKRKLGEVDGVGDADGGKKAKKEKKEKKHKVNV